MATLQTNKTALGYELRCGEAVVEAVRQPDLYFIIECAGKKHKGYLKNLKKIFLASLGIEATEALAPPKPQRAAANRAARELSQAEECQKRIDEADTRIEQINLWVHAYNLESVAVRMGAERHPYVLPPGEAPDPPLELCFHPARKQYVWPCRYEDGM